jgi:hypothetical protein
MCVSLGMELCAELASEAAPLVLVILIPRF